MGRIGRYPEVSTSYVYERVRDFLARRHKVPRRSTRRFSYDVLYGERGVLPLERTPRLVTPCASR
jgi:RNA-directed DNA polymerase